MRTLAVLIILLLFAGEQAFAAQYTYYAGSFGPSEDSWVFAEIWHPRSSIPGGDRITVYYWSAVHQEADYWNRRYEGEIAGGLVTDARAYLVEAGGPAAAVAGIYTHSGDSSWGYAFVDPQTATLYAFPYEVAIYPNGGDGIRVQLTQEDKVWTGAGTSGLGNPFSVEVTPDELVVRMRVGLLERTYLYRHGGHPQPAGSFFTFMDVDDRNWPWVLFDGERWGWCVGNDEKNFWIYTYDHGWIWTSRLYWPWGYRWDPAAWVWLR